MAASIRHKRGGRPLKPQSEIRNRVVAVKLNAVEMETVMALSERSGLRPGPLLRKLALGGRVIERISPDTLAVLTQLGVELRNIGINLNALAKRANAGLEADYSSCANDFIHKLQAIIDNAYKKLL